MLRATVEASSNPISVEHLQAEGELCSAVSAFIDVGEQAHAAYPSPDEVMVPPYGSTAPYHPITSAEGYPAYMASTMPCTLPPLTHFSDAIKREAYPEESLSPYVNYGYVSGVEVNGHGHYEQHSNPHVSHDVRHYSRREPRS